VEVYIMLSHYSPLICGIQTGGIDSSELVEKVLAAVSAAGSATLVAVIAIFALAFGAICVYATVKIVLAVKGRK
jgi:hypothetical protein